MTEKLGTKLTTPGQAPLNTTARPSWTRRANEQTARARHAHAEADGALRDIYQYARHFPRPVQQDVHAMPLLVPGYAQSISLHASLPVGDSYFAGLFCPLPLPADGAPLES